MYRANKRHLQAPLMSDLDLLSAKAQKRLDKSWAGAFYGEFFCRLDETPFAVLYSDEASRPNIPVNVLVGLESLKAGFGWSDEEMYDAFSYNVQVRYALGYRNLGDGEFELRTVYNFRHRLSEHMAKTGENLLERAFAHITDAQVIAFGLKTGRLRMDSSQVASNIQRMSRLQLLVEMLQRVQRMLTPADQARYAEVFEPYLKGTSGQYVYQLKGEETSPHLQRIGELMYRLAAELAPAYAAEPTYQLLERVFRDQFIVSDDLPASSDDDSSEPPASPGAVSQNDAASTPPSPQVPDQLLQISTGEGSESRSELPVLVRPGKEISPASLRSPDDLEATYRKKGERRYEGYVFNLTETCDADNPFQLILKVQTESNTTEDTTLLLAALLDLLVRTEVHTLYNDAAFCGPVIDRLLALLKIEQIPSNLQGVAPQPGRVTLADCHIAVDDHGQPQRLTCPHGHTALVEPGTHAGRFIARWREDPCPHGCFWPKRPPASAPLAPVPVLRFSQIDLSRALRRQRCRLFQQGKQNLRAAIEASIGAVKRPFGDDQLPVRGKFRMGAMLIGSAAMVNIRRIQRYLASRTETGPRPTRKPVTEPGQKVIQAPGFSFFFCALDSVQAGPKTSPRRMRRFDVRMLRFFQ
jgi:hypothetical protein